MSTEYQGCGCDESLYLSKVLDVVVQEKERMREALRQAEQRELTALADLDEAVATLRSLCVWADNWLPDEEKEQGAREVIRQAKALIAAQTPNVLPSDWTPPTSKEGMFCPDCDGSGSIAWDSSRPIERRLCDFCGDTGRCLTTLPTE